MILNVFPAHAGMSPTSRTSRNHDMRFPRPRGDEPARAGCLRLDGVFSPPTRG